MKREMRARRARLEELHREVSGLRESLAHAYGLFNRTADAALLEASILEISALLVRYDRLLRDIKSLDLNGENEHDTHHRTSARHRGRPGLPVIEAAAQADQMGA